MTDHSSAAETARRLEEIEAIYNSAPIGLCVFDTQFRYRRINDHLAALNGVLAAQHIGRTTREVAPDLADWTEATLRQVVETGQSILNVEFTGTTPAQPDVWRTWMVHWLPLKDTTGLVTGVSVVVEEITDRKLAEEALRENEERYRLLAEAIPQLVWRCDAKGDVLECNRRWYEYTGQTPEEAKGNGWMKALHPDDVARVAQWVPAHVVGGEIYQVDYQLRRASDGSYRWHLAQNLPLRDKDGKTIGWFGSATDIDDRKRAEEELTKSKAILQATIENLPFDFFAIGQDGRYMMQNAASKMHWGDATGKLPQEVCSNKHDLATWLDNNRRAFAGEKVEGEVELTVEGEKRFYYNVTAPIQEGEQILGILGTNVDISERKRAEAALQQAHDELEQRVQQRTAELAEANEELAIFRRFAEASSQGFSMATLDGYLTYLNPAFCRMLGEEMPEDRIGQHLSIYYSDESSRRGREEIEPALMQKGHWEGELPMLSRQGKSIPTWHHSFVIRDERGNPLRMAVVITDITERKQAEEAVLRAKRQWERTFDSVPDLIAILDDRYRIVQVNQAMAKRLGLMPEQCIGLTCYESIHGLSQPPPFCPHALSLADGKGHDSEVHEDRLGGDFLVSTSPLFDEQGQMTGSVHVARDITERKRAEEALRTSEEKHRGLVEACPDAVVMTDLDGRVLFASLQTWRLLGLSDADDLLGRSVFDYVIEEDRRRLAANLSDVMRKGLRRNTDYTALRKDGSTVACEASSVVIRDVNGQPKAAMAVIRDITDRKQAEVALQQSEERYRAVVEDQTEVISRFKADGTFTFVNEVFCRFFGKTSDELLGNKWHPVVVPEDLPMIEEQLRALSPTNPIVVIENRVYSGTGEVHWMQFVNRGFFDREGQLLEVQAVGRDITERKRAEEALQREHRTLQLMLQSSDHERQLIAYEIHDGLAQQLAGAIMQFDTFDHLKDKQPKDAVRAFEAGMTMLRQGHFEARRLISGVRPPVLDESGVVEAIAHLVHEESRRKGPKIEFESKVDFDRLVLILENAIYRIAQEGLTNACNHSQSPRVRISLVQRANQVRIEIRDWGVGFDPQGVQKERFGLAGIRERARLLGGKCRIQSKPGKGTSIVVELPVVEREAEE